MEDTAKGKNKKEIGTNGLLAIRKNLGLSQLEVAERIGVSIQSLDRWEKGKGMPSLPHLLTISAIYKTLTDEIYFNLYKKAKMKLPKMEKKVAVYSFRKCFQLRYIIEKHIQLYI
jgi:transcriptional regulator with XRE-family HTH domain